MQLQTLGHATMLLRDGEGAPLLITDPWLIGSCYWRSWWLENYPSDAVIDELSNARACYITHEHPDHYHMPSIRRLGKNPIYLTPGFAYDQIGHYLGMRGYRAQQLMPHGMHGIGADVGVTSIPTFGNDSVLVVETPDAMIVNANDARLSPMQLGVLAAHVRKRARGRRRVLLSSYSSAGIANSLFREGRRLSLASKRAFVRYVTLLCRALNATHFLPFASQVVYRRPDSSWANDFKVRHRDLQQYWGTVSTELLPPFTTLDLETGDWVHVDPADYDPREDHAVRGVRAQVERERDAKFTPADAQRLTEKLAGLGRHALWALFPRGLAFEVGGRRLHYNPWTRRLSASNRGASALIHLPVLPLKDVLNSGHFADLCIPMFARIDLDRFTDPRVVASFFMLALLHDTGATRSLPDFVGWLRSTAREQLPVTTTADSIR